MTDTKRGRATSKSAESGGGDIAAVGRETVENEIGGLRSLLAGIGTDFERAVRLVLECRGKTIVCGIGKSGIVARKIAATLSSTGTPSVYLHPVEAMHGDMGMVTADDVFLAVSKSGNNEEITRLLPHIRSLDVKMISITAAANAVLARESDVALLTHVDREACPMDIVPTTSTTAAMVLGDALAVAVFRLRDFSEEDFAKLHPSGVLGKRLILTVAELMHAGDDMPLVSMETTLKEALFVIAGKRLGCAGVADPEGRLAGIVTDGDLKRILMKNPAALEEPVGGLMTPGPRTTTAGTLAVEALRDMELGGSGPVTQLFVLDANGRPVGVIHIHDIVRAGLR
ncbi:MAG: KpsF/GutQ family sugar-phosphate isomerase [Candidatus Krumholzibacteriota bacterium]|nr:KpsF/GutQ family sugar-phosphate isomerase [Candidatus Krumholzibacteriota bacterium]